MDTITYYDIRNAALSFSGNVMLFSLVVIFLLFTLIAIIYNVTAAARPFLREREYIKMEIKRSFDEEEYRYWKRRLKKLYLRSIPFIGRFF